MRQKRAKAYRKLMHLYCTTFGFRQPYQILGERGSYHLVESSDKIIIVVVDSEMCKSAVSQKLDFTKQLFTVLQGDVKPMITQCCIHELYLQGREQQPAVALAKSFERRKCNHREPIAGDDCLESVIGETNKHRYVVATQSHPLRAKLRSIPATPIIHINRSVTVLEPPSDATLQAKARTEEQKLHAGAPDLVLVDTSTFQEEKPKKRKGPKGPNPLSVKKKKAPEGSKSNTPKNKIGADEAVKAGSKRKAEHSDEDDDHALIPESESAQLTNASTFSKRRKRRRKANTVNSSQVQNAEAAA
ncbi:Fcf1-domain-containing protein [Pholiota conissans]|uniref:U three protein 23 n=1 Tax=Pholiota conissans TaxID=109636 RepID=A0A9P5YZP8_9AGAR|nr:Fcf1-domain-containing protein [Pholiota conissans]